MVAVRVAAMFMRAMFVGAMTVVRTILMRVRIVAVMSMIVMSMIVMIAVRVNVRVVRCHRGIVQETRGRTLSARPFARVAALDATRVGEEREGERPEDRRHRRETVTAGHRQRIEQPTVGAILLRQTFEPR